MPAFGPAQRRLTEPLKPLTAVTVQVPVPHPLGTSRGDGLQAIRKEGMGGGFEVGVVDCPSPPLHAVTIRMTPGRAAWARTFLARAQVMIRHSRI